MPDLAWNRNHWEDPATWSRHGDEWSDPWGGTHSMWLSTVLPRIDAFLPADAILEIAPGHGRWSQYLKDRCRRLILVDISESCIETCRARFGEANNITYHVNDGQSLDMVSDESIDFAFSFDSLVHVEIDVIAAYIEGLSRKLKPDGVAVIHHSNLGEYRRHARLARLIPDRLRRRLTGRGLVVNLYSLRAVTVTAGSVARRVEEADLECVGQEKLAWDYGRFLTDAISIFTRPGSAWSRPNRVIENPGFPQEVRAAGQTAQVYGAAWFTEAPFPAAHRQSSST